MANPRLTLSALVLTLSASVMPVVTYAQQDLTPDSRERYVTEIRSYKHQFLTKELGLTKEAQRAFLPMYDQMEDEVMQMQLETRALERKIHDDKNATDTEVEAAATAVFSLKEREAKLEMEYFEKFKTVLTPRQLLKLRSAEKQFNQTLLRHHRKHKEKKD